MPFVIGNCEGCTRFSAPTVVKSNHQKEIVDVFITHWIAITGTPGETVSDNGEEFNNSSFINIG